MRAPNPPFPNNSNLNWLRRLQHATQSNKILPGQGYRVKYGTQGTILQIEPGGRSSPAVHHPFHIYKSPGTLLASGASGVDVYNGGALPTVDDDWRCFAIRGGIINPRPQYVVLGNQLLGDNEYLLFIQKADDGVTRLLNDDYYSPSESLDTFSSTLTVKQETVNIPNVGDVTVTDETGGTGDELLHAARWVLNSDLDDILEIHASFWIEISDDDPTDLPTAKIKARMWTTILSDSTGRTLDVFPIGRNIIPIGTVNSNYGSDEDTDEGHKKLAAINYLDDHVLNRRLSAQLGNGDPALAALGPTYWRGQVQISGDTVTDDYALTDTVFYPGDMLTIIRDAPIASIGVDFGSYYNLFIYWNTPAVISDFTDPFSAGFALISGLL